MNHTQTQRHQYIKPSENAKTSTAGIEDGAMPTSRMKPRARKRAFIRGEEKTRQQEAEIELRISAESS